MVGLVLQTRGGQAPFRRYPHDFLLDKRFDVLRERRGWDAQNDVPVKAPCGSLVHWIVYVGGVNTDPSDGDTKLFVEVSLSAEGCLS